MSESVESREEVEDYDDARDGTYLIHDLIRVVDHYVSYHYYERKRVSFQLHDSAC